MNDITKHRYLLTISRLGGFIPLVVGWSFFLLWVVIFKTTGDMATGIQIAGFYWIGIGFVMAIIGLICLLIYGLSNKPLPKKEVWPCFWVILSNIPSVFLILFLLSIIK